LTLTGCAAGRKVMQGTDNIGSHSNAAEACHENHGY
jgi:hypothetical protein